MHYKNGRKAELLDPVVFENWDGKIKVGTLTEINSTSVDSCNAIVAYLEFAGINKSSVILGKMVYHAEDAYKAVPYIS